MSLRDQIAALPGGGQLTAIMDKVNGDPEKIRAIAARWRLLGNASFEEPANRGEVAKPGPLGDIAGAARLVDDAWNGDSARAFIDHMKSYGNAGLALQEALDDCAKSLENAADSLDRAKRGVNGICETLLAQVATFRSKYRNQPASDVEPGVQSIVNKHVEPVQTHASHAETAVSAAARSIDQRLGENRLPFTFEDIKPPEEEGFVGTRSGWTPVTPDELSDPARTTLSGDAGGGTGTGGGAAYSGVSGGGGTPAPKEKVVNWIQDAIKEMKDPRYAAELRRRGIDLSDLDPNDPKDIERIWTIIFHESGGNPDAINNWDINAQNGVPSQGLMQTIPPTFNAHKLPGHDEIRNPVDNIIAGVLYTYGRYGDLAHHPGIWSLENEPNGGYKPY
ncbi:transglycosylase SLT domain-containing protein [Nonomuraea sp. B19D2]|uniref:transglycosylase SLT domain-containing protein n=1 Tax=Nonomuraea sp. B19D2 TaxID=3159561 RepID=UPI0032DA9CB0